MPNNPSLALQPGNTWGCTYCDCTGNWEGTTCNQCGLNCFNGGSVSGDCTTCNCPTWWTGNNCQYKYWLASFTVNLNPPNYPLNSGGTVELANAVLDDLLASIPTIGGQVSVEVVGNKVSVWIYAGESSPVFRANLKRQIFGTNYQSIQQGLNFPTTLTGSAVQASSYSEQDPPSAGAFTAPSLLLTLVIMLMGIFMN